MSALASAGPVAAAARPAAPLVGITGPRLHAAEISTTPQILLHAYCDAHYVFYPQAVARAGGLPVHLPREADPEAVVARLDALVVAGGQDVDPRRYGSQPTPTSSRVDPGRDSFELALIEAALARGLPLLGICRGMQLLNVARGGTLIDDLPPVQAVEHTLVIYPPEVRVHAVELAPGTALHDIYGPRIEVNSFHHQGIGALGAGLAVAGTAPDGIVEAVELPSACAIGVQWHPEMLPGTDPLFHWLLRQATDHEARAARQERRAR
ncbi:gamma-glutamyl-gamma-aminobutyrate hydrolase family protein [Conexibacter arvalis]|uniref:Putative glutamine amidotransferase n=1 Tax=Conexibacter arvalis TaxID=912552 RepID=A0A840I976_9ACTN|nr:gamma-glutamyl-gamma-aminobutyrate hydrolase family protein [Conexibacter arvalis]MBB4660658.1 putative glutamine amidotransferase [Conexibacter arvalis]